MVLKIAIEKAIICLADELRKIDEMVKSGRPLEKRYREYLEIVSYRDKVLADYQPLFQPDIVTNITKEAFVGFLRIDRNHHWDSLQRVGPQITTNMTHLRKALSILLDETRPIRDRLEEIRPLYNSRMEDSMVPYLGFPTLTAILLIAHPEKYGVWNGTSMDAMRKFGIWDERWLSNSSGISYLQINNIYLQIRYALKIDLWTLDALWWVVKG